jgi:NTE family protein
VVIAVSIQKVIANTEFSSVLDVLLQSIDIMGRELVLNKARDYDVLIEPKVAGVGMTDFSQPTKKRLMEAGIEATQDAIPRIRAALAGKCGERGPAR